MSNIEHIKAQLNADHGDKQIEKANHKRTLDKAEKGVRKVGKKHEMAKKMGNHFGQRMTLIGK